MTIKITKTLINKDFEIDVDLEVSTMSKFYEIQRIFQNLEKSNFEDRKLWLEMLVYRLAEIFQNCIRSYEYLEKFDLRDSFLNRCKHNSSLEFLKKTREDMFHHSKNILNQTIYSDFFQINGEYFKGIHVKKGGFLWVGDYKFNASDSEFVFTTEGIFEIKNPYSKDELWQKLNYPSIITFDDDDISTKLKKCHSTLQSEFFKIRKILRRGDGKYEYKFKTKGNIKLFGDGKICDLNGKSLEVKGTLNLSPMNL